MRKVDTNGAVFQWCVEGSHDRCKRQFERFYFDGRKTIFTSETVLCACAKRGCKCKGQTPVKKTVTLKEL